MACRGLRSLLSIYFVEFLLVLVFLFGRRLDSAFAQAPAGKDSLVSLQLDGQSGRDIPIFGIDCTGTGATEDGVCLRGNLPRGFGFGLTGKRWRCGLGTRLRPTHRYRPRQVHRSGAWMAHFWPPWSGLRLDPLQWPPMLRATECKITTGFRDELLQF
jgi:hypothetical protein